MIEPTPTGATHKNWTTGKYVTKLKQKDIEFIFKDGRKEVTTHVEYMKADPLNTRIFLKPLHVFNATYTMINN